MNTSSTEYDLTGVSLGDVSTDLARRVLTTAKARATLHRKANMSPSNTEAHTQFLRGAHAELEALIQSLENVGVLPK